MRESDYFQPEFLDEANNIKPEFFIEDPEEVKDETKDSDDENSEYEYKLYGNTDIYKPKRTFEDIQFKREFGVFREDAVSNFDQYVEEYFQLLQRSEDLKNKQIEIRSDDFKVSYRLSKLLELFKELRKTDPELPGFTKLREEQISF